MGPALAPLVLSAVALSHPTPVDDPRCQQIREVRQLAAAHQLPDRNLARLEAMYCRRSAPPVASLDARNDESCRALTTMIVVSSWSAAVDADVVSAREVVCAGLAGAPGYWPSGRLARSSSGAWYWPSGQLALSSSGAVYHPSGTLARSSSGAWYYPSGQLALGTSGRWYTPRGEPRSEDDLVHAACRSARERCSASVASLREATGEERTTTLLAFVWSALG